MKANRPANWLILIAAAAGMASGQEHHHSEEPVGEHLGSVHFPISCLAASQAGFDRGLALLHSFGYSVAQKQFEQIEQRDPGCAMAYWGDAMTYYHQLWDRPSVKDLERGRELIGKAQAEGHETEREQGFIQAAAAFYGGDPKRPFEARASAYRTALANLHSRFPGDREAAIFYALALIATSNNDTLTGKQEAVSILNGLLQQEPNHPGVAHYLIHACDNPKMARDGLAAARRYAQIAPDAPHALHMPSHIFARLGYWQDDIQSNLSSKAVAEKQEDAPARGHAMDFLEYAYLQTGQTAKAKAIEEEALQMPPALFAQSMPDYWFYIHVHFPVLLGLETRNWKEVLELKPPAGAAPDFRAGIAWAHTIAAAHLHDRAATQIAAAEYDNDLAAVKHSSYAYVADSMQTESDETHAWNKFAQGDDAGALALLRKIADQQDATGKGEVEIPAREMLADMLLELHRPAEALLMYEKALQTDPKRFNELYGAGLAAQQASKPALAKQYFHELLADCPDGDRTELALARAS